MTASSFTAGQRRTVILMVAAIMFVLAMLAGLIITSIQGWESVSPLETVAIDSEVPTPAPTASPTPTPIAAEPGLSSQVQAARLVDQIAHQVELLRGLSPRSEVPLSFLDDTEMDSFLRQLHLARNPAAELLPYTALGLLPDQPISLTVLPAPGLYVPEQQQFYFLIGREQPDPDAQSLLARAHNRALQDQYFDLSATGARAETTDSRLAIQALMEGDAALLAAQYRYEGLVGIDWEHLTDIILQVERPSLGEGLDRVEAWARLQRFPFWEGRQFVETLFEAGGWRAIDQAYSDPPRSTEEVLHPQQYLAARDTPLKVAVPDLKPLLGGGWTTLLEDSLGEFVVGLYLDGLLPGEGAWRAAEGWDGDSIVVWQHDDGRRSTVWRTIWEDAAEAREFERALVESIPQRFMAPLRLEPPDGSPGLWWQTDEGGVTVYRVARHVTFAVLPDVATLVKAAEVLP